LVLFSEKFWLREEKTMFMFVHHVHYVVEDLEKVISYMEKNFEMLLDHKGEDTERGYNEAIYKVGRTLIEFTQPTKIDTSMAKFSNRKAQAFFMWRGEPICLRKRPNAWLQKGSSFATQG